MAKKTKRSYIAIVGGIVAILGVGLSIFIKELGWWNVLSGEEYTTTWTSAFFGNTDPYFADEFNYLLPGIIAALGGLLCLFGNKMLSIVGGVVIIAGIIVFIVLLPGSNTFLGLAEAFDKSPYWDTGIIYKWRLGIGFFITCGGAVLALLGGLLAIRK